MHSLPSYLRGALAAAAMVLAAGAASAGPILDAAGRAEQLADAGKPLGALDALDEAVAEVWRQAPLSFRTWVVVDEAQGYGIYEPRADAVYRPGETMKVYVEPVGFAYGGAAGLHEVALSADLAIETPGGQILAGGKDIFSISVPSRNRIRELNMTLSFAVPQLAADEYRAVFTVRDRHSDKSGEFAVPFRVAAP
jgi:hypothetical protein